MYTWIYIYVYIYTHIFADYTSPHKMPKKQSSITKAATIGWRDLAAWNTLQHTAIHCNRPATQRRIDIAAGTNTAKLMIRCVVVRVGGCGMGHRLCGGEHKQSYRVKRMTTQKEKGGGDYSRNVKIRARKYHYMNDTCDVTQKTKHRFLFWGGGHTHAHMCTRTHVHTHAHTHTCTHAHTRARTQLTIGRRMMWARKNEIRGR